MARKPDVPCAGTCGKLLWSGSDSLPAGERMCRDCRKRVARRPVESRECTACGTRKPIEEFHRDRTKPSGHRARCKPCVIRRLRSSDAYKRAQARRDPSHRKPMDRRCAHCCREFTTTTPTTRYCSLGCAATVRKKFLPAKHPNPSAFTHLPEKHPARQPEPPASWWQFMVAGSCEWCEETFVAPAASWETRSLYCSDRCAKSTARARRGRFVVPPKVREAIYERDGWRCQIPGCPHPDEPIDPDVDYLNPWAATLDHIEPRSWTLVPDDRPENLRLAHRQCNAVRGDARFVAEVA